MPLRLRRGSIRVVRRCDGRHAVRVCLADRQRFTVGVFATCSDAESALERAVRDFEAAGLVLVEAPWRLH